MVQFNPVRLLAQTVLLHLCVAVNPAHKNKIPLNRGTKTSSSANRVDFLRKVVAPAQVPGQQKAARTATNVQSDPNKEKKRNSIKKLTAADLAEEKQNRKKRRAERKARALEKQQQNPPPVQPGKLERMPEEHVQRELGWFSSGSSSAYSESFLVDPSEEYDKWAQAYRFLGGYIDCDHSWGEGGGNSGSGDNGNNDQDYCSRWMIYACYVNPNYQGNEYYEYFADEDSEETPPGVLDCHSPDTEWQLLGVYRQEHYQYIEQISKHLWGIEDEEYVVALAGLAYMTDEECYQVQGDDGDYLYVSVKPTQGGDTQMALYTDAQCLLEDSSSGLTPDDFGLQNDVDLGSQDQESSNGYAYDWWYAAQEYTLTDMNSVYRTFQYCTTCVDYPTYQDGYFIGDYGTDDDDMINQCWKFWSHDAFVCEHDCLSKANAQGTILHIDYGDKSYGYTDSTFYEQASASRQSSSSASAGAELESPLARLLANAFLTLTFLLFVATFLAFAVARRSRYRESRSSRSRRLLDDENQNRRSSSRRRSKSQSRRSGGGDSDGDGLFRDGGSRRSSRARSSKGRASSSSRRAKSYDPDE